MPFTSSSESGKSGGSIQDDVWSDEELPKKTNPSADKNKQSQPVSRNLARTPAKQSPAAKKVEVVENAERVEPSPFPRSKGSAVSSVGKSNAAVLKQRHEAAATATEAVKAKKERQIAGREKELVRGLTTNVRERFDDIPDALSCGICALVFYNPVQITSPECNHVFCARCLEQRTLTDQFCPECGYQFTQNEICDAYLIQSMIWEQRVACYFDAAGCEVKVKYKELNDHEIHCEYNPNRKISCLCGEEVEVPEFQTHLEKLCPDHKVLCPHGCEVEVKRKNLKPHEETECPMRPSRCDFAPFGCAWKGAHTLRHQHNKDDFDTHMALMVSKIQSLETDGGRLGENLSHMGVDVLSLRKRDQDRQKEIEKFGVNPNTAPMQQILDRLGAIDRTPSGAGARQEEPRGPSYEVAGNDMRFQQKEFYQPYNALKDALEKDREKSKLHARALADVSSQEPTILQAPTLGRLSRPTGTVETNSELKIKLVRPTSVQWVSSREICVCDITSAHLFDADAQQKVGEMKPHSNHKSWRPRGIAFDPKHNRIFVTDSQFDCVHVFSKDGQLINTFGSKGKTPHQLSYPLGIAFYESRLFVCDSENQRVQVYTEGGAHVGSIHENSGTPLNIAVGPDGRKYVTVNTGDDSFVTITAPDGKYVANFGQRGQNAGEFSPNVKGVAIDSNYNIFVTSGNRHKVQIFRQSVHRFSAEDALQFKAVSCFGADIMQQPGSISVSPETRVAVADEIKNKVYIY